MEIIKPSVELWEQKDDKQHIAKCARICYATPDNGKYEGLVNALEKSGHVSMFRHLSIYAIIPMDFNSLKFTEHYEESPYLEYFEDYHNNQIYITTNGNFMLDIKNRYRIFYEAIEAYKVTPEEFNATEIGHNMMRYTFKVVTQISTSRELNRVSPNNIAEQSTRYVSDKGEICQPHWMNDNLTIKEEVYSNIINEKIRHTIILNYIQSCNVAFNHYNTLIAQNLSKEDARGVLPLDTATVCAYTYSIKQWHKIIDLRYYGTTGKPHPNAKIIAGMIKDELVKLGYEFK